MALLCTTHIHESIVDNNDNRSSVHAHKSLPSQGLGHVAGSRNFDLWAAEMKFPSVSILTECEHATHTCIYVHVSQSTLVHEERIPDSWLAGLPARFHSNVLVRPYPPYTRCVCIAERMLDNRLAIT